MKEKLKDLLKTEDGNSGLVVTLGLTPPANTVLIDEDIVIQLYRCQRQGTLKVRFTSLTGKFFKVDRLKHILTKHGMFT